MINDGVPSSSGDSKEARPKKCIMYTRVSSHKQTTKGTGLSSQERSCRDYAETQNYEVVEVFSDVISGKYAERPGMNALITFLRKKRTDKFIVVVDDISRFARDVSTHATLRDKLTALGAKIDSPNQKFGEDASSIFVETIMAALSEHERRKIGETAHLRTLNRMKNGLWSISAKPIGYEFVKHRAGGKILAPKEPVASIVKEALEGFASGRLASQCEVKRFLESKPEFPKTERGNNVHWDRVKRILTNVLYAGYLEFPKWDIPLTPALHEPLISFATYQIIQERLAEKVLAPGRKDIRRDFPLRGFLICETWEHKLTSCWSRRRSGKEYQYNICQ